MKSKDESGSPRPTPRLTQKRSVVKPLFSTQLDKFVYRVHRLCLTVIIKQLSCSILLVYLVQSYWF